MNILLIGPEDINRRVEFPVYVTEEEYERRVEEQGEAALNYDVREGYLKTWSPESRREVVEVNDYGQPTKFGVVNFMAAYIEDIETGSIIRVENLETIVFLDSISIKNG
jgi:hypothetical protein